MILFTLAIRFANLLLAALVTGAMFGVWLAFNPRGLSAPTYVVLQQQAIRGLNVAMPVLGLATIIATIAAATLARGEKIQLIMLIAAAGAFLMAGLITRFLNQPINAVVMTWSPTAPPADWTLLRDAWWRWHALRLVCGLAGLSLLILANLLRDASLMPVR